jgi:hypothetical protein
MLVGAVAGGAAARTLPGAEPSGAPWAYLRLENVLEARDLGISAPGALAWDETRAALLITDRANGHTRAVRPQGGVVGFTVGGPVQRPGLTARDSSSGHAFALDLAAGVIVERDGAGAAISRRDVSVLQLRDVGGMVVAPTADTTDTADAVSLYVSVDDAVDDGSATGPGILELAIVEPVLAPSLAAASDNVGHLVQTIRTSDWDPASPDPSGVAYIGDDGIDRLVVSDGEVDETTGAGFHNVNVWLTDRTGGNVQGLLNTKIADPVNREPVGDAYDPVNDRLYLSRDGDSSRVWVYHRDGTAFTQIASFSLSTYGVGDAEGLAFGNGALYVGDGSNKEVWEIRPGADGLIDGIGETVTHFDTAALGISDAEGIGVHPDTGNLFVASRHEADGILEVTPNGTPVSRLFYDFSPTAPGGLEVAPSSSDPNVMSLWIVDRGIDNNDQPSENDGKLYEVSIEAAPPPPPPPDPGENIFQNGDFETAVGGQPSAWSQDSRFTQSSSDAHTGTYAGRHFATDNSGYKIDQTASAVGGVTYAFSGWVNAPATADGFRIVLKIQWRAGTKSISTVTLGKVTKPTGGWTEIQAQVTAPGTTTSARAMMVVSSLNTTIYVDDFVLAAAP